MNNQLLLYKGGIQHAAIEASSSGDTTVVSAKTGKHIVVLSMSIVGVTAVGVKWKSGSTTISGVQEYPDTGGIVRPWNPGGWMQTAAGEALVINLDGAVQVGGELTYQVVE